jgi:hypothetical protein
MGARRGTAAVVLVALTSAVGLVGCGDSDGGTTTASFCDKLQGFSDIDSADIAELQRAMEAIEAVAPDEIKDQVAVVEEGLERLNSSSDDPAALSTAFDSGSRQEFSDAGRQVSQFSAQHCRSAAG